VFKNKAVQKDALCFLAGAANTLKREGKRLTCYNTDIQGFVDSLREDLKFNSDGKSVFIFGCGGASRAVIAGLTMKATRVKKIYLYDIKKEAIDSTRKYFDNFQEVKGRLEYFSDAQRIPQEIKGIDLLINASPVGMREGDSSIIDKGLFSERLSVYDLVYNRQTQLIQDAQSLNLNCIGGLKMLWRQGMLSFKIWTGKDAPAEVMWQALSSQILTK
jgi:shikimate dehydrogenase